MLNNFYSWLHFQTNFNFIHDSQKIIIDDISKSLKLRLYEQNIDLNIEGKYSYLINEDRPNISGLIMSFVKQKTYIKYVYAVNNIVSYIPDYKLNLDDMKGFNLMDYVLVPTLESKNYIESNIPNIKNVYFMPFEIHKINISNSKKNVLCIDLKDLDNEEIKQYLNMDNLVICTDNKELINKNNFKYITRIDLYNNIQDFILILDFYNDFLSSIIQKKALINNISYIGKSNIFSQIEPLLDLNNNLDKKIELSKNQIKLYSKSLNEIYSYNNTANIIQGFIKDLEDNKSKRNYYIFNETKENLSYQKKLKKLIEQIPNKHNYIISDQDNFYEIEEKLKLVLNDKYEGLILIQKSEIYPNSNFNKKVFLEQIGINKSELRLVREMYFGSSELKLSERELILFVIQKKDDFVNNKIFVMWEGYQLFHISLAVINRELELKMIDNDNYEISIFSHDYYNEIGSEYINYNKLEYCINKPLLKKADFHIRHVYPTGLIPPNEGKYILIFPWEAGNIPKQLVEHINNEVDELWCPSQYIRQLHIISGVFKRKIHVVPNGIDLNIFKPRSEKYHLKTQKKFKFLFVGGLLFRKGLDILLEAYLNEFSKNDDVTLIIKGVGKRTYYNHKKIDSLLKEIDNKAEIILIDKNLDSNELSLLYNTCDVYVHPYRAEGFGMPIFESMACGTPTIITRYGAGLEYCNDENSFLIDYNYKENLDEYTFIEPSLKDLQEKMRFAYDNKNIIIEKSKKAINDVKKLSWDNVFSNVDQRLNELKFLLTYRHNKDFYINLLKNKLDNFNDNIDILNELKILCSDIDFKEIMADEKYNKSQYKDSLDIYTELFNITRDKKYLEKIINLLDILGDNNTANKLRNIRN